MGAMATQITSLTIVYSFWRRSKKISKLRVSGLCGGHLPVTGEFPAQMASNAENVSIWWRHHGPSASGAKQNNVVTNYSISQTRQTITKAKHVYIYWISLHCMHFCWRDCKAIYSTLTNWGLVTPYWFLTSIGSLRNCLLVPKSWSVLYL